MTGLLAAIRGKARQSRRRVAIGVTQLTPELMYNLWKAKGFAEIIPVGKVIPGFESKDEKDECSSCDRLVSLVKNREVDAIIRGQLYYTYYHDSMKHHFGFKRDVMCPSLLRDACGHEWFITPVVHTDDVSIDGRCYLATQAARICTKLGIDPVIGVLAADNERGYSEIVDRSLDDAEAIVLRLKTQGYNDCAMYALQINKAAEKCNIVIPMDGIVGNFVCRSLAYLGGATLVGGFSLTPRFVSLDTSRCGDQFHPAIETAVAMCNLGGMPVEEYCSESS
jgi:predicted methyltransferase MtxX (methanogen marker protein 4)